MKTCVVTGATTGIGKETAKELAKRGYHVVVVGRDAQKAAAAVAEARAYAGHDHVESALCDFSKQSDIRALAADLNARLQRIDLLVNNAGAMFDSRQVSADGYEMTFAVNHLGYFLLTTLLLDKLKASAPARIVSVASSAHSSARIDVDNIAKPEVFSAFTTYGNSKLANILFTRELAKRLKGTGVTANCVHPGVVASGFGKNNGGLVKLALGVGHLFMIKPDEGAKTTLYVATAPELDGVSGKYFAKSKETEPRPSALNDDDAARLWALSEKLTHTADKAQTA